MDISACVATCLGFVYVLLSAACCRAALAAVVCSMSVRGGGGGRPEFGASDWFGSCAAARFAIVGWIPMCCNSCWCVRRWAAVVPLSPPSTALIRLRRQRAG